MHPTICLILNREGKKRNKDFEQFSSGFKKPCTTSSSGASGAKLLEELRNDVKKKEEEARESASATLLEKQRQHQLKILHSLVNVSDALRSHFISSNRTVLAAAECYKALAESLKCSKKDVKEAVVQIAEVVPGFLTIVPPDSLLNYRTIKLDFQTAYSDSRNAILEHVTLKLA